MSESSFYLGPTADRWCPESWDDVVSAAADGLLDESSWVELKADVPASNPASNLETARDLASLTLDGGLCIVGIRDNKGRAGAVVGADVTARPHRAASSNSSHSTRSAATASDPPPDRSAQGVPSRGRPSQR